MKNFSREEGTSLLFVAVVVVVLVASIFLRKGEVSNFSSKELAYPRYNQAVTFTSEFYGNCTGKLLDCRRLYTCFLCKATNVKCDSGAADIDMKVWLPRYSDNSCEYANKGEGF